MAAPVKLGRGGVYHRRSAHRSAVVSSGQRFRCRHAWLPTSRGGSARAFPRPGRSTAAARRGAWFRARRRPTHDDAPPGQGDRWRGTRPL